MLVLAELPYNRGAAQRAAARVLQKVGTHRLLPSQLEYRRSRLALLRRALLRALRLAWTRSVSSHANQSAPFNLPGRVLICASLLVLLALSLYNVY